MTLMSTSAQAGQATFASDESGDTITVKEKEGRLVVMANHDSVEQGRLYGPDTLQELKDWAKNDFVIDVMYDNNGEIQSLRVISLGDGHYRAALPGGTWLELRD